MVALALSGCATTAPTEPKIVTQIVKVPTPVPCTITVKRPDFLDTDAALRAAPNSFERLKLVVAGRLQHWAYEGELEAAQKACEGGAAK
jgi:hypothetical protein